jgi:type VI protein secretion system component VasK
VVGRFVGVFGLVVLSSLAFGFFWVFIQSTSDHPFATLTADVIKMVLMVAAYWLGCLGVRLGRRRQRPDWSEQRRPSNEVGLDRAHAERHVLVRRYGSAVDRRIAEISKKILSEVRPRHFSGGES